MSGESKKKGHHPAREHRERFAPYRSPPRIPVPVFPAEHPWHRWAGLVKTLLVAVPIACILIYTLYM